MKNITHTLVYADMRQGYIGIGCIRFKHGRIRMYFCNFVRMKIISLIFIRFSYVSLIRNSVTGLWRRAL